MNRLLRITVSMLAAGLALTLSAVALEPPCGEAAGQPAAMCPCQAAAQVAQGSSHCSKLLRYRASHPDKALPLSGAIRFRTQFGELGRFNDLSQRIDFDLRYQARLASDVVLNLELGSGDWTTPDVLRERHGRARLKRAWVNAHFGGCTCR